MRHFPVVSVVLGALCAPVFSQNECPAPWNPVSYSRDSSNIRHHTLCVHPVTGQLMAPWLSVQDAGGQVYNVKAYGATGDGVTVDTVAVQSAISAANGRTVFFPRGTYIISSSLLLSIQGTAIIGEESGSVWETGNSPSIIRQANSSNLSSLIHVTAQNVSIKNLEIDGNKGQNPTSQDAIFIDAARNVQVRQCWVHSAKRYNVYAKSSGVLVNDAAIPRILDTIISGADSDGARIQDLTDPIITGSEFEANGGYGLNLLNAPGGRIEQSDFASNTLDNMILQGTSGGLGSGETIVVGNQFGNGFMRDINIQGWNGISYSSTNNTITGNHFFSGGNRPDGTYPSILLTDTQLNAVSGNTFNSYLANRYTYALSQVSTGHTSVDSWVGNAFNGNYSSGVYNTVSTYYCTNSNGNCVVSAFQASSILSTGNVIGVAFLPAGPPAATCVAGAVTFPTSSNTVRVSLNNQSTCSITWAAGSDAQEFTAIMVHGGTTATTTLTWPANVHGGMTAAGGVSTVMSQRFRYDSTNAIWYATSAGVSGM